MHVLATESASEHHVKHQTTHARMHGDERPNKCKKKLREHTSIPYMVLAPFCRRSRPPRVKAERGKLRLGIGWEEP